ncbi:MAG TPA: YbaB/EbfC family nucleoid-associated protein, partial [Allosphingosinicella sp.]
MPSIEEIMKMAQDAQTKLMEEQAKLEKIEVEGAAGGGMVKVRASAKGRVLAVTIDDSLMGDKQMLEDLVAAAFNDARNKAEAAGAESMSNAMGGLPL